LFVENCVEDFGNDWEERDGSVVGWESFVFCFVDLNDFCEFERIWVLLFVNCSVEESGQCWCEEVDKVFEDDGLDFVDVCCFVCFDGADGLDDLLLCDVFEAEIDSVMCGCFLDMLLLLVRYGVCCFMSDGDVVVRVSCL